MAVTAPVDIPVRFVLPPSVVDFLDELRAQHGPVSYAVADLDALDDLDEAPEVLGIRVYLDGGSLPAYREYPTGRTWDVEADGRLLVVDEHGRGIAEYPHHCWSCVEDILAEVTA